MGFLGSLIVLAIFAFLLEKITNKLLGVEKRKISETPGKNIDRWGRGIILVILLCTLPFVFANDIYNTMWYWVFYGTIIWGFQSILERNVLIVSGHGSSSFNMRSFLVVKSMLEELF